MVLAELAAYLEGQGLGTRGTDLFYGTLEPEPDSQVCLYEYGGLPNEPDMGTEAIRTEFPLVQIVSRGAKDVYDAPRLKLQQIVASLAKIGDETVSGVQYQAVMAKSPVFHLHRDANFRHVFACNFMIVKDFSTT